MNNTKYEKLHAVLIDGIKASVVAINKNSRLHTHLRHLIVMHNLMRICILTYELEDNELKDSQEVLHRTILAIKNRKPRTYTTQDKIVITLALSQYENLIHSCDDVQLLGLTTQLEKWAGMGIVEYATRERI